MLKSKQYFQPWRIFRPTVDRLKASPLWGWKSSMPKSKQDFQAQRIFRPRVKGLLESLHAKIQATFLAMVDFHSQEWETSEAFLLWSWKKFKWFWGLCTSSPTLLCTPSFLSWPSQEPPFSLSHPAAPKACKFFPAALIVGSWKRDAMLNSWAFT